MLSKEENELQQDIDALKDLIVNCPELAKIEALLGNFNLFQVLKFEYGEIRHSNVLAWLMNPNESHGLDSHFLQKWLMRVLFESNDNNTNLTPIDIDAWNLISVDVRREWRHIDLLLVLKMNSGDEWVVCIENKINSKQHSNQLLRYRSIVEKDFSSASNKIFILLSKEDEIPEDSEYITASYSQIHQTLQESVSSRNFSIGDEPRVLISNYLRLLEEKFMNESEIARLSQKIYNQHKRALDIIFEHRPDNLKLASDSIREGFQEKSEELGVIMGHSTKTYIRFIPKQWDQDGNHHGRNWGDSKHSVSIEINLSGKAAYFVVVAGNCPSEWIDPLWQKAHHSPFTRTIKFPEKRPKIWVTLYSKKLKISFDEEELQNSESVSEKVVNWAASILQGSDFKEVVNIISAQLPKLHDLMKEKN